MRKNNHGSFLIGWKSILSFLIGAVIIFFAVIVATNARIFTKWIICLINIGFPIKLIIIEEKIFEFTEQWNGENFSGFCSIFNAKL